MKTPISERRRRGRPRLDREESEAGVVQALDRGLRLLHALAGEGRCTLSEIALRVGLSPSSAHRLLMTLQRNRMVEFDETTQEWSVGVAAFRIGSAFIARSNIVEAGLDVMRRLVASSGETANIAIADGGYVVFLSQVETPNPIRAFFPPGTRAPMHASGIGKVLLAEMDREDAERTLQPLGLEDFTPNTLTSPTGLFEELEAIRQRGWALDNEERYTGMRCIAAPIFDPNGTAVAGISISGPTARLTDEAAAEMGPKVRAAAAEVTNLTGGRHPHRP